MRSESATDRLWPRARRIGLVCTGIWCVGLGVWLAGTLIGSSTLASTNTAVLLMIVGVIVLPAVTLIALRQDRKVARRAASMQLVDDHVFTGREVVAHDRHDRAQRHTTHAIRSASTESETGAKVA